MNKKLLIIGIILAIIGVIAILYMDTGTYETNLNVISQGEWKGYYELTINNTTTHENIAGGG